MYQRHAVALLAVVLLAWTRAVSAEPIVGWLGGGAPEGVISRLSAFERGLKEAGFIDGQNVTILRSQKPSLDEQANELIAHPVAVLATNGNLATRAATAVTATIPIVYTIGGDPVALGLAQSLSHPAGNATGVSLLTTESEAKRLQLLTELVPNAATIGLVVNPRSATTQTKLGQLQQAAKALGRRLRIFQISTEAEVDSVFATMAEERIAAVAIASDALFTSLSERFGALVAQYRLPAIFVWRDFVAAGGLASYGPSLAEAHRQAGTYVGRILKGEKPGDLPVLQSTKIELVLNLKAAKALGLTISLPLSGRADEILE